MREAASLTKSSARTMDGSCAIAVALLLAVKVPCYPTAGEPERH